MNLSPAEDALTANPVIVVEVADRQATVQVDSSLLAEAVRSVIDDAGKTSAEVSVAVVDDATIQRINRDFLSHDYPTDVLSFALEETDERLEGEIILSAETAVRNAREFGQPVANELLLYAIHGALHLVGYEDKAESSAGKMRAAEERYMKLLKGGMG